MVSNAGTKMQEAEVGWLMTPLAPSPVMAALWEAATEMPILPLGVDAAFNSLNWQAVMSQPVLRAEL